MDFTTLLVKEAVDLLQLLMDYEKTSVVALACFQQIHGRAPNDDHASWREDLVFITHETTANQYMVSVLNRNRENYLTGKRVPLCARPWAVVAEILGASSEGGSWVIFAQMDAEIALLGLKMRPDRIFEQLLQSRFGIQKLAASVQAPSGGYKNEAAHRWYASLKSNYL
jgi:hypothetical protein